MKQGRASRSLLVAAVILAAASALAACQVVSGLSSIDEPTGLDAAGTDGRSPSDDAPSGDARQDALADGAVTDGGADAKDAPYDAAPSMSCSGLVANCATYDELDGAVVGPAESCCARRDVPAGTTSRVFDYVDGGLVEAGAQATLSKFALDRFEVTVGRFKKFLDAYDGGWRPPAGSGRVLHAAGDPGWTFDAALKPTLGADVAACDESTLSLDARVPINCITYAEAFAFCIYDGGRLPTEAEWSSAAAGGAELRMQPFSNPPSQLVAMFAYFEVGSTGPALVGLHPPGDGKFGHADLLGNMAEWTRDAFVTPYPSGACNDCIVTAPDAAAPRAVRGSGFDVSLNPAPRTTGRDAVDQTTRTWDIGVRCAYDLP